MHFRKQTRILKSQLGIFVEQTDGESHSENFFAILLFFIHEIINFNTVKRSMISNSKFSQSANKILFNSVKMRVEKIID